MDKSIAAVVVLYNCNYKDSITLNSLKPFRELKLIVCDNSIKSMENENIVDDFPNAKYIPMGGNAGLSKAYNRAVDELNGEKGYVCLFDDDTKIGADYFDNLRDAIDKSGADVLLPTVYDEVGLLSPCNQSGVKSIRVNSVDELDKSTMTGINSAMAINLDIFEKYRYDEGYFLDYIDHAFLRDMKRLGKQLEVFDADLHQRFSSNNFTDIKGAKIRYKLFKADFKRFCSGSIKDKIYGRTILIKRWMVINVRMRLLRIYKKYIKHENI